MCELLQYSYTISIFKCRNILKCNLIVYIKYTMYIYIMNDYVELTLRIHLQRDTLEPIASSLSSAFYIQHQQRQFHMLQMAQLASLNYLGHGIQAPPPQQTPPPDYVFDQRSLTPSSSSADDKKEDSLSAKKRSRVFIDPLTEIPKLEVITAPLIKRNRLNTIKNG